MGTVPGALTGECLMVLTVDVGPPVQVGQVAGQARRYVPLLGGSVEGAYRGSIAPGGVDWQSTGPDGMLEISARYVLQLEQGHVEVRSEGLRAGTPDVLERLAAGETVSPDQYYFRTAMRFYTAAPELSRLNELLAIAVGERLARQVRLQVFPVL